MALQSDGAPAVDREGIAPTSYAVVFAGVVLLTLSRVLVPETLRRLQGGLGPTIEPQVATATVYGSVTAVVIVAVGGLALRQRTEGDTLRPADRVRLPLLLWALAIVAWYLLLGSVDRSVLPASVLEVIVADAIAMGALALVLTRLWGRALRLDLPAGDASPILGVTVLGAAVTGAAYSMLRAGQSDTGGTLVRDFLGSTQPALEVFVESAVVIPLASAVGLGLLFNGAIQERVAERQGPTVGIAASAAFAGTFWVTAIPYQREGLFLLVLTAGTGAAVALLAGVIAGGGLRRLERARGSRRPVGRLLAIGTAIATSVVAIEAYWFLFNASLFEVDPTVVALVLPMALAVSTIAAVAAAAYERSHTVWLPVAAYAAFFSTTTLVTEFVVF